MSKIPTRPYCSSCNKQSHGENNCKGGKCSCKCRSMTIQQLDKLNNNYRDDVQHVYSEESQESFEKFMEEWRGIKTK